MRLDPKEGISRAGGRKPFRCTLGASASGMRRGVTRTPSSCPPIRADLVDVLCLDSLPAPRPFGLMPPGTETRVNLALG
jgi:hypothetical protein